MSLRLDLWRALNVKIRSNSGLYMQHTKYIIYKIGPSDIFSKPDLQKKEIRVGQNWVGRVGKTTNFFSP